MPGHYARGAFTGESLCPRQIFALRRAFSGLAAASFPAAPAALRKGTIAMTNQLTAGYEGTEPFPGGGSTPRTFEAGVRIAVTAAIVVVPFGGLDRKSVV